MGVSHNPPPPGPRRFLWRRRVWFEATFGLAMLDTWEVWTIYSILLLATTLLGLAMYRYMPTHARFISSRASYYLHGDEHAPVVSLDSILGLLGAGRVQDVSARAAEKVDL